MVVGKCAMYGNNHVFAYCKSRCYVDDILPGWDMDTTCIITSPL